MCGRFARYQPLSNFAEALGIDPAPVVETDDAPRYNIAPGTRGWLLALDLEGDPVFTTLPWFFPTSRGQRINVRAETAHVVPEYKEAFARHRCLALATGFYEPEGAKSEKHRPWWYFEDTEHAPLFLGAVAQPMGFAILTRSPVDPVACVHDRSPVLVPSEHALQWIDPALEGKQALALAGTAAAARLHRWRVSDAAKRAAHDGPDCIAPLQA